jgi:uncharacterized protein with ParB-like and HNH nuclease domain
MTEQLDKEITTVKALLSLPNLNIPVYQRPYKWSQANLADLLSDLKSTEISQLIV